MGFRWSEDSPDRRHGLRTRPGGATNMTGELGTGDLKDALRHVLWIGGATDSGKTSVTQALVGKYGLQAYHYDRYDREEPPGHWARADPVRHPHMVATPTRDRDWMFVHTTAEELVERWIGTTPERFELTLEDLLALPPLPPIVADGFGFMPELVQPLLSSPRQAIWLVSTEEFKRESYARRQKDAGRGTTDPERARYNHFHRDVLLAERFRRSAEERDLRVMIVDGTQSLEEVMAVVEAHFGELLRPRARGVSLQPISAENERLVIALRVKPGQEDLVASNEQSLRDARAYPSCKPFAIYAGETVVGFLMLRHDYPGPRDYYLLRLIIGAGHQGRGYGRAALRQLVHHVRTLPG